MSITISSLELGPGPSPMGMLVRGGSMEETVPAFMQGWIIRGATERPILVDTGPPTYEAMVAAGIAGAPWSEENDLEAQLARFDLEPADIGMILMTHLHIDHSGGLWRFPMTTPVVVERAEVAAGFAGSHGHAFGTLMEIYPEVVMRHVMERIYAPGAMTMLDLDLTGPLEIVPGITCEAAGGHSAGSMLIRVQTDEGVATICGDVVYNVKGALIDRTGKLDATEPSTSNNFVGSVQEEIGSIHRALRGTRFLMPGHDVPAVLGHVPGRPLPAVIGRMGAEVPGPIEEFDVDGVSSGAATKTS